VILIRTEYRFQSPSGPRTYASGGPFVKMSPCVLAVCSGSRGHRAGFWHDPGCDFPWGRTEPLGAKVEPAASPPLSPPRKRPKAKLDRPLRVVRTTYSAAVLSTGSFAEILPRPIGLSPTKIAAASSSLGESILEPSSHTQPITERLNLPVDLFSDLSNRAKDGMYPPLGHRTESTFFVQASGRCLTYYHLFGITYGVQ